MADHTLTIGAPSLRGEDARDGLKKKLAGVRFPLTAKASNHFPFKISFPWAGRLFLQPSGHPGHQGEAAFKDSASLERFVSDVQAIAEMRKVQDGILLEWAPAKAQRSSSAASTASAAKPSSKTDA